MAKTAVVSAQAGFVEWVKALPARIQSFYNDVRNEMRKVSTPARKEVQATTVVVIITVFIFGMYFGVVDWALRQSLDKVITYFGTH